VATFVISGGHATYRTFRTRSPPEFRQEAVRLARTSEISIARDLGIADPTLRNWIAQTDVDEGRKEGLTSAEREELKLLRRENKVLREEREILKEAAAFFAKETGRRRWVSCGFLREGDRSPEMGLRLIEAKRSQRSVSLLCGVLGVSRSGFYAWQIRPPSKRRRADDALTETINDIYKGSGNRYGAPKIHAELADGHKVFVGRKRVAALDEA
jgi:transposase